MKGILSRNVHAPRILTNHLYRNKLQALCFIVGIVASRARNSSIIGGREKKNSKLQEEPFILCFCIILTTAYVQGLIYDKSTELTTFLDG